MSNISNENKIPKTHQLLTELANWANETVQFQDLPEQQEILEQINLAYMCSDFADNNQERNNAIVIFRQFSTLNNLLMQYSAQDFQSLDKLILKLLEPCTTETN